MRTFFKTVEYNFKNFFKLFLFALIPASYMGGLLQTFGNLRYLIFSKNIVVNNYGDIAGYTFSNGFTYFLVLLFAFLILGVVLSMIFGYIDTHFKTGEKDTKSSIKYLNENVLVTFAYILLIILTFIFFKFVLSLLFFVFHILFSGLGDAANIFTIILNCVTYFSLSFVFILILNIFLLCIPETLQTGYNMKTSISNVNNYLQGKNIRRAIGILIPIILLLPIMICGMLFGFEKLSTIIVVFTLTMYFPVYAYIEYFNLTNAKRYDIKEKGYFN